MAFSEEMARHALVELASCAEFLHAAWNEPRRTRHKGRIDLVTTMDVAVQERLSAGLARVTPGIRVVGEEGGPEHPEMPDACWVVDPIDGTTNFVHRIPFVGITAAYCEEGRPVFGMTVAPELGETWWARKGAGTLCNGRPVRVSDAARLEEAVVATGFPYHFSGGRLETVVRRIQSVLPRAQGMRRIGAASLDLAYVACGRQDAYYEADLHLWDYMAGWLLVEEAGGRVTNESGEPFTPGDVIVSSNGLVHDELVAALA